MWEIVIRRQNYVIIQGATLHVLRNVCKWNGSNVERSDNHGAGTHTHTHTHTLTYSACTEVCSPNKFLLFSAWPISVTMETRSQSFFLLVCEKSETQASCSTHCVTCTSWSLSVRVPKCFSSFNKANTGIRRIDLWSLPTNVQWNDVFDRIAVWNPWPDNDIVICDTV